MIQSWQRPLLAQSGLTAGQGPLHKSLLRERELSFGVAASEKNSPHSKMLSRWRQKVLRRFDPLSGNAAVDIKSP